MPTGIRVEGGRELEQRFGGLKGAIDTEIARLLREVGKDLEGKLKHALTGEKLNVRSGHGRDSIGFAPADPTTNVEVGVIRPKDGKVLVYLYKQEIGGQILPKGQFLVFPTKGNPYLTKAGVGGISFGSLSKEEQKRTRGQWAFVRSVTLPATHWFSSTVEGRLPVYERGIKARIAQLIQRTQAAAA